MTVRVGMGFDSHPFALTGELKLGGVVIPHGVGLEGHSDGDAVAPRDHRRDPRGGGARLDRRALPADATRSGRAPTAPTFLTRAQDLARDRGVRHREHRRHRRRGGPEDRAARQEDPRAHRGHPRDRRGLGERARHEHERPRLRGPERGPRGDGGRAALARRNDPFPVPPRRGGRQGAAARDRVRAVRRRAAGPAGQRAEGALPRRTGYRSARARGGRSTSWPAPRTRGSSPGWPSASTSTRTRRCGGPRGSGCSWSWTRSRTPTTSGAVIRVAEAVGARVVVPERGSAPALRDGGPELGRGGRAGSRSSGPKTCGDSSITLRMKGFGSSAWLRRAGTSTRSTWWGTWRWSSGPRGPACAGWSGRAATSSPACRCGVKSAP